MGFWNMIGRAASYVRDGLMIYSAMCDDRDGEPRDYGEVGEFEGIGDIARYMGSSFRFYDDPRVESIEELYKEAIEEPWERVGSRYLLAEDYASAAIFTDRTETELEEQFTEEAAFLRQVREEYGLPALE